MITRPWHAVTSEKTAPFSESTSLKQSTLPARAPDLGVSVSNEGSIQTSALRRTMLAGSDSRPSREDVVMRARAKPGLTAKHDSVYPVARADVSTDAEAWRPQDQKEHFYLAPLRRFRGERPAIEWMDTETPSLPSRLATEKSGSLTMFIAAVRETPSPRSKCGCAFAICGYSRDSGSKLDMEGYMESMLDDAVVVPTTVRAV